MLVRLTCDLIFVDVWNTEKKRLNNLQEVQSLNNLKKKIFDVFEKSKIRLQSKHNALLVSYCSYMIPHTHMRTPAIVYFY